MKAVKGDYGYIQRQKKVRLIRTIILYAAAFAILGIGLYLNNGSKRNVYTIIAMIGIIPSSMSLVSMIMMWMRKPMEESLYREIRSHAGSLMMMYELFLTTREKNLFLDAAAICGEYISAYTSTDPKKADIPFMEEHIRTTMKSNGYHVFVKIFTEKKHYLERLDSLAEKKEEYERDTDYEVRAVMQAISL